MALTNAARKRLSRAPDPRTAARREAEAEAAAMEHDERRVTDAGISDFMDREKARGGRFIKRKSGVNARDLPAESLFASGLISQNELFAAQTYSRLYVVAHYLGRYPSTLEYMRGTNDGAVTHLWAVAIRRLVDLQRRAFGDDTEALRVMNHYCGDGEPISPRDTPALARAIGMLAQTMKRRDWYVFD